MSLTVLNTDKTDKDKAEEYKQKLIELHKPLLSLYDEAIKDGFIFNIGVGPTPTGHQLIQLQVLKSF